MTEVLELSVVDLNDGLNHGRPSTYNNKKCRCPACTQAWTDYIREKGYVRAYQERQRQKKAFEKANMNGGSS